MLGRIFLRSVVLGHCKAGPGSITQLCSNTSPVLVDIQARTNQVSFVIINLSCLTNWWQFNIALDYSPFQNLRCFCYQQTSIMPVKVHIVYWWVCEFYSRRNLIQDIHFLFQRRMRVRPQVPQAEAAAWGQVPRQCRGHRFDSILLWMNLKHNHNNNRRGHPGHHWLARGPGGGRRAPPQQEERRRVRWHRRQAPEDLRWSHCRHGLSRPWCRGRLQ